MEHHIWQAHMVSALSARKKDIILAFEAFPRRVQPALDRWIAGQLTDRQFLEETDWVNVWNFDPELYMLLFELARLNELPMLAMNVEQALVRKVGQSGWASVPVDEREDMSIISGTSFRNIRLLTVTKTRRQRHSRARRPHSKASCGAKHFGTALWRRPLPMR